MVSGRDKIISSAERGNNVYCIDMQLLYFTNTLLRMIEDIFALSKQACLRQYGHLHAAICVLTRGIKEFSKLHYLS